MMKLSLLVTSLAMTFSSVIFAAEPVLLRQTTFSKVRQQFHAQTPGLLHAHSDSAKDLRLIHAHTSKNQMIHSRMQQYYLGYPVFGGYAIIHSQQTVPQIWSSKASNTVQTGTRMNGTIYQGLESDLGRPAVNFVQRGQEALQHFTAQFSGTSPTNGKVHPIVFIDQDNTAHWAYKVSVDRFAENQLPARPTAILDAESFNTYVQWNDIKTARSQALGRGYGGNERVGLYQFGRDLPLLPITRNDVTGVCYMENKDVRVIDMMHHDESQNHPMHFMCDDSRVQSDGSYMTGYKGTGYDKVNGAYSPANDAMYAGNIINDMYKNWYGVNPLESAGKQKQLLLRIHYRTRFENAFWDGEQVYFGDGGLRYYPMVSVGISAHEISHGFTEQHSDLAYFGQSGGINESFSDMAAQAAEYFSTGKNSWKIGADVIKPETGVVAFRYMDKPSQDGFSIDNAKDFTQDLDVHYSSGIYNRFFYLLANTEGWNVRKAFNVMLTANSDYWTPTSTFSDAACGVLDAARSFDYSQEDIKEALNAVGVNFAECYDEARD